MTCLTMSPSIKRSNFEFEVFQLDFISKNFIAFSRYDPYNPSSRNGGQQSRQTSLASRISGLKSDRLSPSSMSDRIDHRHGDRRASNNKNPNDLRNRLNRFKN